MFSISHSFIYRFGRKFFNLRATTITKHAHLTCISMSIALPYYNTFFETIHWTWRRKQYALWQASRGGGTYRYFWGRGKDFFFCMVVVKISRYISSRVKKVFKQHLEKQLFVFFFQTICFNFFTFILVWLSIPMDAPPPLPSLTASIFFLFSFSIQDHYSKCFQYLMHLFIGSGENYLIFEPPLSQSTHLTYISMSIALLYYNTFFETITLDMTTHARCCLASMGGVRIGICGGGRRVSFFYNLAMLTEAGFRKHRCGASGGPTLEPGGRWQKEREGGLLREKTRCIWQQVATAAPRCRQIAGVKWRVKMDLWNTFNVSAEREMQLYWTFTTFKFILYAVAVL